jgi:type IV pilus assembly protein PilO
VAALPKDRRGQILLLLTVAALVLGYFGMSGLALVGLKGFRPLGLQRDSLQREIDTITAQVARAKHDVATGSLQHLDERLAEFSGSLALMRQLVPSRGEVPNLLDDVTSRAKMRGTTFAGFTPQAVESGTPFDTQRYRLTVTGEYDQISEFLTDIASLPRIIVPYDVHYQKVQGPAADSSRAKAILTATFAIRTYVKLAPDTAVAKPPAAAPAPAARPAPGTRGGDE